MLRPYLGVVRTPGVATPLATSFLGSLPIGMLNLAVLMMVRSATGSFGRAGIVAAALGIGSAAGLIVQGNLIDRLGQPRVLVPAGLVCACSLALLTVTATGPTAPAFAAIAGLTIPAVPSCMRVLMPTLIGDLSLRTSAYALLAVMHQVTGVLGPLIVSAWLLLGPTAAVWCTATLAAGAAIIFASTPASRRAPRSPHRRGWLPQGFTSKGMRTLLLVSTGAGLIGGLTGVGIPAIAVSFGEASLAGPLIAVVAIGSCAGGLVFGGRSRRADLSSQVVYAQLGQFLVLLGITVVLIGWTLSHPLILAPLLFLEGFVGAPIMIAASALVDRVAARQVLTESYTTLIAASLTGIAIGNAAAGRIGDQIGEHGIFAAATIVMIVATGWTFLRRRTLLAS